MDKVSKETRSRIMAQVRSQDNRSTERRLRSSLAGAGISGYKMHEKNLPGKPDFVFHDKKVAIFVDGCFWHGCPTCYRRPHSSQEYWDAKVRRNAERDHKNCQSLKDMGWLPVRIWEHSLDSLPKVRKIVNSALRYQQKRQSSTLPSAGSK